MSLHETAQEAVTIPAPELVAEATGPQPPAEPEVATVPGAEATAATQGYRHVREDGTIEYASSREEVLKLCPVLGKLATKDPDAANLLLDMASIGQAKATEEQHAKPDTSKSAEPPAKPLKVTSVTPKSSRAHAGEDSATAPRPANSHFEQIKTVRPEILELSTRASGLDATTIEKNLREIKKESPQKNAESALAYTKTLEPAVREDLAVSRVKASVAIKRDEPTVRPHTLPVHKSPRQAMSLDGPKHNTRTNNELPDRHKTPPVNKSAKTSIATRIKKVREKHHPHENNVASAPQGSPKAEIKAKGEPHEVVLTEPAVTVGVNTFFEPIELWHEAREQAARAKAVEQDPSKFFDNFTEELRALIAKVEELSADDPGEPLDLPALGKSNDKLRDGEPQPESTPAIVLEITEQLEELEPHQKAAISFTLQAIVEAAHTATAPEAAPVYPEVVKAAAERLEKQVTILFDQLGIDYKPKDVDQFIKILPRLNLQLETTADESSDKITADLEHDGTREAKWRLSRLAGGLLSTEYVAQELLGRLALRHSSAMAK